MEVRSLRKAPYIINKKLSGFSIRSVGNWNRLPLSPHKSANKYTQINAYSAFSRSFLPSWNVLFTSEWNSNFKSERDTISIPNKQNVDVG